MKCEEAEQKMMDYLDNSLSENERAELEKHISTCERCLDCFNESQKILKMFSVNEPLIPDEKLKINFYHMLHDEIHKQKTAGRQQSEAIIRPLRISRLFLAAAGIALLIAGTFLGILLGPGLRNSSRVNRIDQLQSQIDEIRRNEMFSMLNKESSSYRLQGVSYAEELGGADESVIDALIKVLNTDKNVNVRLAAAFSLSKFTDKRVVCDSLVASLPRQVEPILQITLINILTEIREKSALRPIEQIINSGSTLTEVRKVAEKGAKELML